MIIVLYKALLGIDWYACSFLILFFNFMCSSISRAFSVLSSAFSILTFRSRERRRMLSIKRKTAGNVTVELLSWASLGCMSSIGNCVTVAASIFLAACTCLCCLLRALNSSWAGRFLGSVPKFNSGSGCNWDGSPSTKCAEQTLCHPFGSSHLCGCLGSALFMALSHRRRSSSLFDFTGKGWSLKSKERSWNN